MDINLKIIQIKKKCERKVKEGKKGEKRHIVFSLLTEEIVEYRINIDVRC